MAQGVAWAARELGVPATIVVPEHAPQRSSPRSSGSAARVVKVPFERWWQALVDARATPASTGLSSIPCRTTAVMAGNGTIGLELARGPARRSTRSSCPGAAAGLRRDRERARGAAARTRASYAVEPETGAPLAAALAAGEPRDVDYRPSFVDGAGSRALLPTMWERREPLLDGAFAVSLDETAAAVRLLAERARVVAEGAGALAVAAALAGRAPAAEVVCIVSGGNIDAEPLATILGGETPS